MTCHVYFIQVMPDGPIKIGQTSGNIVNRVIALQQASPYQLKWIGAFRGGRAEEKEAHKLLAGSRCRGEWFHPTQEVRDFIREKCPDFTERGMRDEIFLEADRAMVRRAVPAYQRNNENLSAILSASGMDIWEFWKWINRERAPDPIKARRASECAAAIIGAAQ